MRLILNNNKKFCNVEDVTTTLLTWTTFSQIKVYCKCNMNKKEPFRFCSYRQREMHVFALITMDIAFSFQRLRVDKYGNALNHS